MFSIDNIARCWYDKTILKRKKGKMMVKTIGRVLSASLSLLLLFGSMSALAGNLSDFPIPDLSAETLPPECYGILTDEYQVFTRRMKPARSQWIRNPSPTFRRFCEMMKHCKSDTGSRHRAQ